MGKESEKNEIDLLMRFWSFVIIRVTVNKLQTNVLLLVIVADSAAYLIWQAIELLVLQGEDGGRGQIA